MTQAAPPRRAGALPLPTAEAVISTGAALHHRTVKWRDPRTSSLPLRFRPPLLPASVAAACLLLCLSAPAAPPPQPAPAAFTDAIARAFVAARVSAHLRPLSRIPDRPVLRRIVCSAASNNSAVGHNEGNATFISRESEADAALVPVIDPNLLPQAIQRVAEYDDRATAHGRRITRFSVAAFTTPADPSVTWVGIALYWSRFTEFAAGHFTRTYAPPDLHFDLTPECLSIQ